jgi:hypothetical protein
MPFVPSRHTPIKPYCNSPEHNPPDMIVLEPGAHVWQCPACGQETTVGVPSVRMHSYGPIEPNGNALKISDDHTEL